MSGPTNESEMCAQLYAKFNSTPIVSGLKATLGNTSWAPVSEPGFLDFQISRLFILEIFVFCEICLENILVRYRGINNKGVLERPWTKWKVLRAISTTYIEMSVYRKMLKSGLSDAM